MVKGIVVGKGAAGLRRSAIAERIRLREEWSSLKGTEDEPQPASKGKKQTSSQVFSQNLHNIIGKSPKGPSLKITFQKDKKNRILPRKSSQEVLLGVVALVDIGSESKALALRAALTALGATVVLAWNPTVTHLVWAQGGCRNTRARARSLACHVVSPLWVEACAASGRKISEKVFPSTARASDLPSPAALCRLLKTAEKENWQLSELLLDSDELRPARLRISSDTEDNSNNKTEDADTTQESIDEAVRVNTAPRRAKPVSTSPPRVNPKFKRKLFTVRAEADDDETDAEESPTKAKTKPSNPNAPKPPENVIKPSKNVPNFPHKTPSRPKNSPRVPERQKTKKFNLTQEQKKNLEKAGRLARKLAAKPGVTKSTQPTQTHHSRICNRPRIVLSGMPLSQHQAVVAAVQALNGKIQKQVNHRTTHVLLGKCKKDPIAQVDVEVHHNEENTNRTPQRRNLSICKKEFIHIRSPRARNVAVCSQCNSPRTVLIQELENDNVTVSDLCSQATVVNRNVKVICSKHNRDTRKDSCAVITDKSVVGNKDNALAGDNKLVMSDKTTVRSDKSAITRDNVVRSDEIIVVNANDIVTSDVNAVTSDNNTVRSDKDAVRSDKSINNPVISDNNDNNNQNHDISDLCESIVNDKSLRTLKTLLGAVRGCKVLHAQWALDSQKKNCWLNPIGYEVAHLLKVSRKARLERSAIDKVHKEYAYDVFGGMRVSVSDVAEQKNAAIQLLSLCGAVIVDPSQNAQGLQDGVATQDGVVTQDGVSQNGANFSNVSVRVGKHEDEVSSKWVFDSVAAGRPRTTRRYLNKNIPL